MTLLKCVALLVAGLFAFSADASGGPQYQVKVTVTLDEGEGERRMELDSTNLGVAVQDMEVGEVQTVLGTDGKEIYVTRHADGVEFNVDGDIIQMPTFEYSEELGAWMDSESNLLNLEEAYLADNETPDAIDSADEKPGVTIISSEEIDEETKRAIRTALATAGQENVRFVGGDANSLH